MWRVFAVNGLRNMDKKEYLCEWGQCCYEHMLQTDMEIDFGFFATSLQI